MEHVLFANSISKVYDVKIPYQAITNVTLHVDSGEFVGVMGPSGAGKTTLLNLISTIDYPTSGEITINGKQPHKLKKEKLAQFRRRELGFVFQDFNLLDTLTIKENIILPLILEKQNHSTIEEKVNHIALKFGITNILNKRTFEVSGGEKQRTAIARAIIHNPSLLLADEPTGNLDSKSSKMVMETFLEVNSKELSTMLMVTHDPFAASYCHRVVFIKDGEIYNELYKGANQQVFFQQIIDVLSMLGGNVNELLSTRF
ncbi:ABC transporter ATP-binding protein [Cytobacillus sp. IB215665]|uniref:ABC transporter ATP-binding protein n=1 Tax=Cytobacillus sp. IB215665 TaxID=3097357 RepID=UPI002A14D297|nr:ABC transporter ATP-binding protein [Cytobacillus sp. IB215665]MDX8367219.1 ABC transporter ATP-binding protein [Cytobacillus sp. IB215665]